MHQYYEQDHEMNNQARLDYFDDWFKINSEEIARQKGLILSTYLSQIKDFTSFKAILQEVFSLDNSLSNYVSGFSDRSFRIFFERPIIQDILNANRKSKEEFFIELQESIPKNVQQVKGKPFEFFKAIFQDKISGKSIKVIAKKDVINVRGKEKIIYRDSRGRFVKRV